jgi:hypothetical protein
MADTIFPKGIFVKKPHSNAPSFVIAKISIKRQETIAWLNSLGEEYINMDLKRSKGDAIYLQVDEWKPSGNTAPPAPSNDPPAEVGEDGLPF